VQVFAGSIGGGFSTSSSGYQALPSSDATSSGVGSGGVGGVSGGDAGVGGDMRALPCEVGQFVLLNVPAISTLEWHPFSISSAPVDSETTHHIKVSDQNCPQSLKGFWLAWALPWVLCVHNNLKRSIHAPIPLRGPSVQPPLPHHSGAWATLVEWPAAGVGSRGGDRRVSPERPRDQGGALSHLRPCSPLLKLLSDGCSSL